MGDGEIQLVDGRDFLGVSTEIPTPAKDKEDCGGLDVVLV